MPITAVIILAAITSFAATPLLPSTAWAGPTDSQAECEAAGGTWTMVAIDNCINYTDTGDASDPNSSKAACEAAGMQWLTIPLGQLQCIAKPAPSIADGMTLAEQALSYTFVSSLAQCISSAGSSGGTSPVAKRFADDAMYPGTRVTISNAKSGDWFVTHNDYSSVELAVGRQPEPHRKAASWLDNSGVNDTDTDRGRTKCNTIVKKASSLWGYTSPWELLIDFVEKRADGSSAETGSGADFAPFHDRYSNMVSAVKKKVYAGDKPKINDAHRYLFFRSAFIDGCKAVPSDNPSTEFAYTVKIVNDDGTLVDVDGTSYEGLKHSEKRYAYSGIQDSYYRELEYSCKDIADKMNEFASAYAEYRKANPNEATGLPSDNPGSTGTEDEVSSCPVEGIGWVVCPVLNAMGGLADAMWGLTEGLLNVSPLQTHDPSTGAETTFYAVWKQLMGITNAGFVIVFLVIIFFQLIGGANLNYGIKKMLPRLVVGVILGSLSFLIMQLAVDLANISGSAIYDMLNSISAGGALPSWEATIAAMVTGGIAIDAVAAGIAIAPGAALMIALVAALPVVIGFIAAVLTLIVRQALIPILAILAPLAFLARVLPNTEKWFSKWLSLFMSMLLLYPLAALLFGGIKLSAYMINATGDTWSSLIALIVMGVPLFLLPFIARQTGPMLGKLNSSIRNLGNKAGSPISNALTDRRKSSTAKSLAKAPGKWNIGRRAIVASKTRRAKRNLMTEAYQAQTAANQNEAIGNMIENNDIDKLVSGAAAQAHITQFKGKLEAKELSDALQQLAKELSAHKAGGGNGDEFLTGKAMHGATSAERSAAMHMAAQTSRDEVLRGLQSSFKGDSSDGKNSEALQRAIDANASSLVGKAPDLVKGSATAFSAFTGADMAGWSKGTAEAFVKHVKSSSLSGGKDTEALSSLATAVQDIKNNSDLQAKLSGEAGKKILEGAMGSNAIKEALGGNMGSDGKIR